MIILAYDPAMHKTGWALVNEGKVADYGIITVSSSHTGLHACLEMIKKIHRHQEDYSMWNELYIVAEIQQYRHANERARVENLMWLQSVCVGALSNWKRGFTFGYYPSQWKGSAPKHIINKRVKDKARVKTNNPDILDAIGVGLYHYERIKDGRN